MVAMSAETFTRGISLSEAGKLRGPAESLRFLADGAAAVRPATEAEEEIKRKEKLVRERMNKQVRLGLCPGGQMVQACARKARCAAPCG